MSWKLSLSVTAATGTLVDPHLFSKDCVSWLMPLHLTLGKVTFLPPPILEAVGHPHDDIPHIMWGSEESTDSDSGGLGESAALTSPQGVCSQTTL